MVWASASLVAFVLFPLNDDDDDVATTCCESEYPKEMNSL
jgi:hypothetical protein